MQETVHLSIIYISIVFTEYHHASNIVLTADLICKTISSVSTLLLVGFKQKLSLSSQVRCYVDVVFGILI